MDIREAQDAELQVLRGGGRSVEEAHQSDVAAVRDDQYNYTSSECQGGFATARSATVPKCFQTGKEHGCCLWSCSWAGTRVGEELGLYEQSEFHKGSYIE